MLLQALNICISNACVYNVEIQDLTSLFTPFPSFLWEVKKDRKRTQITARSLLSNFCCVWFLQLFNLDAFWCWQYDLSVTIMESEEHQLQANITNEVAEKLLQLSPDQFYALDSDRQRRVYECTLGQQCLYSVVNFKGELLVSVINPI